VLSTPPTGISSERQPQDSCAQRRYTLFRRRSATWEDGRISSEGRTIICRYRSSKARNEENDSFSHESFADECGLHRTYMGGIERGEHNVTLRIVFVLTITQTLDLTLSELLAGIEKTLPARRRRRKRT